MALTQITCHHPGFEAVIVVVVIMPGLMGTEAMVRPFFTTLLPCQCTTCVSKPISIRYQIAWSLTHISKGGLFA